MAVLPVRSSFVRPYFVRRLCRRCLIAAGFGEHGIGHRVEGDPDGGVLAVHPMADMPAADLVIGRQHGQPRRESTDTEYSALDRKGHQALAVARHADLP